MKTGPCGYPTTPPFRLRCCPRPTRNPGARLRAQHERQATVAQVLVLRKSFVLPKTRSLTSKRRALERPPEPVAEAGRACRWPWANVSASACGLFQRLQENASYHPGLATRGNSECFRKTASAPKSRGAKRLYNAF